jgi:hypothetical protein
VSRVSRNHYYCPVCKKTPPAVKIDLSKMKCKPASDPALFRPTPSPTPTPEERIEILKMLHDSSQNTILGLRAHVQSLQSHLDELNEAFKELLERNKVLTERIRNPFKFV